MPITNSTQHSSIYGWNGSSWERVEVNSGNQLEVEVKNTAPISVTTDISGQYVNVANNTDPATSTKQDSGNTILNDIKTNTTQEAGSFSYSKALPVVLTTYEGGSSLNTVGSQSGNVKVYIDDANPDFVANSGMATGTKQDAQTAHLSTLAGAVSGTEMQVDIVSGSVSVSNLPADPATGTKQDAGNASLTALEGSLYAEGDAFGVSDVGVLVMGRNGTNAAKPIHITNNGDVEVEIADFVKGQDTSANSFPVVLASDAVVSVVQADVIAQGSENNIENNASIVAGALSSLSADITNMKTANILYEDSATSSFDSIHVEVSGDSGTNYHVVSLLYPQTSGSIRFAYLTIDVGGLTNLRIRNNSSTDTYTNVNCSVYGSA
jgi:hypothetical protein